MKKKVLYALLSLVIAFGLWAFVITTEKPGSEDTIYNIPVVLSNEAVLSERGLMLIQDRAPTVSLKLAGNRSDLSKVDNTNITVVADLAKVYRAGKQTISYSITFPSTVPRNALEIVSGNPNELTIQVVNRKTKEVPVVPVYSGTVPEGYRTDKENLKLDVQTVAVTGPAQTVDQIEQAVIHVDLEGQKDTISQSYTYTLCDGEGNAVDAELVTTDVTEVNLTLTIQRYREIDLKLNVIYGGGATVSNTRITMDPETIQISGSEQLLNEIGSSLNLGDLRLSELADDSTQEYEIKLPDGITNLTGQNKVTVRVEFIGLAKKTLDISRILPRNLPAGLRAAILTKTLQVTVRGSAAQIARLTEEDVTIRVDMSGAQVGTDTYKALVYLDSDKFSTVGAVGSYSVSVEVSAEE